MSLSSVFDHVGIILFIFSMKNFIKSSLVRISSLSFSITKQCLGNRVLFMIYFSNVISHKEALSASKIPTNTHSKSGTPLRVADVKPALMYLVPVFRLPWRAWYVLVEVGSMADTPLWKSLGYPSWSWSSYY